MSGAMKTFSVTESLEYPRPFDRCYWVLAGWLLAGAYPLSADGNELINKLVEAGIRTVINLMEEGEDRLWGFALNSYNNGFTKAGETVSILRRPVRDMDVPTFDEMVSILNDIDASIEGGDPVYLHCFGGLGRTGTVVGCWLARHGHGEGETVLRILSKLRQKDIGYSQSSPQTLQQSRMVLNWKSGN